mgnify:CR=1 FL=1|tara:strand:+ start:771 stop:2861 length:2091 start_codon:yes stop_codon:yes gene_type:complete
MNNLITYLKSNFLNKHQVVSGFSFFVCLLCTISFGKTHSQNTLQNHSLIENYQLSSVAGIENYLENKFNFSAKNLQLAKTYETKSLMGKHIDFTCLYNNILLKGVFVKVHVNEQNQIFFLQENLSELENFTFENLTFNKDIILRKLKESFKVQDIQEEYILINNSFQKSFSVTLTNERKDIYLQRNYTSETVFTERDLKVHFAPVDTIIYGKVFQPDPLSSAHEIYGGNYQDAFTKDTNILILKKFPNIGQLRIITDSVPFSLYGNNFMVNGIDFPNSYSGDTVYYYFEDIYLNVEQEVLGYNVLLTDDLATVKTEIKTEDYDYEELNAEQYYMEVLGDFSAGKFHLKNNVFEMSEFSLPFIEPTSSITNNFSFNRSHSSFEDVNAFYHLNNYHNYIEELGFTTLAPQKILVDAHGNNGADNSYFVNSPSPRLVFGDGGVDDAEDAAVVIHEYTHALSDFASPGTNVGQERQALDEALGDYFSASYSSVYGNYNKGLVFPWDGHNEFWNGRISNSDSTYNSLNLNKSIYFNAEIMSSSLMDIFDKIGKEITDKLVLESIFYNVANNSFLEVFNNILLIDSVLFDNEHKCDIYDVLVARKFKTGFCLGKSLVFDPGFYTINTDKFSNNTDNAEFFIVEENFEKMNVWISNSIGEIVFKQTNILEPRLELNPKEFSKGYYYVRIQTSNEKYLTKLLKL